MVAHSLSVDCLTGKGAGAAYETIQSYLDSNFRLPGCSSDVPENIQQGKSSSLYIHITLFYNWNNIWDGWEGVAV